MDKVVASAAEAVADIADGRVARGRRVRPVRHPERPDPGAATTQGADGPDGRLQQLRRRRVGPRRPARRPSGSRRTTASLRRREQGVRAAVPRRRARGRADPAGHARRAAAGRRLPASPPSSPPTGVGTQVADGGLPWRYDPDGDGRAGLAAEGDRATSTAASTCSRRRSSPTSRWCAPRSATGTATSSSTRRRATSTRCARWPAGSRSPRSSELVEPGELDPDDVHLPGIFVQRVVALTPEQAAEQAHRDGAPSDRARGVPTMALTREQLAARAALELAGRPVRQPRHRPADAGPELPARPASHVVLQSRERHPRRRARTRYEDEVDPDLINAGKETVTVLPGRRRSSTRRRRFGDDPRRPHRRRDPRRDAGARRPATWPTG